MRLLMFAVLCRKRIHSSFCGLYIHLPSMFINLRPRAKNKLTSPTRLGMWLISSETKREKHTSCLLAVTWLPMKGLLRLQRSRMFGAGIRFSAADAAPSLGKPFLSRCSVQDSVGVHFSLIQLSRCIKPPTVHRWTVNVSVDAARHGARNHAIKVRSGHDSAVVVVFGVRSVVGRAGN